MPTARQSKKTTTSKHAATKASDTQLQAAVMSFMVLCLVFLALVIVRYL